MPGNGYREEAQVRREQRVDKPECEVVLAQSSVPQTDYLAAAMASFIDTQLQRTNLPPAAKGILDAVAILSASDNASTFYELCRAFLLYKGENAVFDNVTNPRFDYEELGYILPALAACSKDGGVVGALKNTLYGDYKGEYLDPVALRERVIFSMDKMSAEVPELREILAKDANQIPAEYVKIKNGLTRSLHMLEESADELARRAAPGGPKLVEAVLKVLPERPGHATPKPTLAKQVERSKQRLAFRHRLGEVFQRLRNKFLPVAAHKTFKPNDSQSLSDLLGAAIARTSVPGESEATQTTQSRALRLPPQPSACEIIAFACRSILSTPQSGISMKHKRWPDRSLPRDRYGMHSLDLRDRDDMDSVDSPDMDTLEIAYGGISVSRFHQWHGGRIYYEYSLVTEWANFGPVYDMRGSDVGQRLSPEDRALVESCSNVFATLRERDENMISDICRRRRHEMLKSLRDFLEDPAQSQCTLTKRELQDESSSCAYYADAGYSENAPFSEAGYAGSNRTTIYEISNGKAKVIVARRDRGKTSRVVSDPVYSVSMSYEGNPKDVVIDCWYDEKSASYQSAKPFLAEDLSTALTFYGLKIKQAQTLVETRAPSLFELVESIYREQHRGPTPP